MTFTVSCTSAWPPPSRPLAEMKPGEIARIVSSDSSHNGCLVIRHFDVVALLDKPTVEWNIDTVSYWDWRVETLPPGTEITLTVQP